MVIAEPLAALRIHTAEVFLRALGADDDGAVAALMGAGLATPGLAALVCQRLGLTRFGAALLGGNLWAALDPDRTFLGANGLYLVAGAVTLAVVEVDGHDRVLLDPPLTLVSRLRRKLPTGRVLVGDAAAAV